jgi:hypothetical protein
MDKQNCLCCGRVHTGQEDDCVGSPDEYCEEALSPVRCVWCGTYECTCDYAESCADDTKSQDLLAVDDFLDDVYAKFLKYLRHSTDDRLDRTEEEWRKLFTDCFCPKP